jgi:hypothetical protein
MGAYALILLAGAGGLVILLLTLGRANESAAASWEPLLTPSGRRAYEELRARFARERDAVELSYERAEEVRSEDPDELALMLRAGYEFIAHTAPDRMHLLRSAALYSRLVAAMVPLPPLRPAAFRLSKLGLRARVAGLVHHLLVTVPERFRLRLALLRYGVGVVVATLAGLQRGPVDDPAWRRLQAARADWHTINDETLESFRVLVSAVAERAPAALRAQP